MMGSSRNFVAWLAPLVLTQLSAHGLPSLELVFWKRGFLDGNEGVVQLRYGVSVPSMPHSIDRCLSPAAELASLHWRADQLD